MHCFVQSVVGRESALGDTIRSLQESDASGGGKMPLCANVV